MLVSIAVAALFGSQRDWLHCAFTLSAVSWSVSPSDIPSIAAKPWCEARRTGFHHAFHCLDRNMSSCVLLHCCITSLLCLSAAGPALLFCGPHLVLQTLTNPCNYWTLSPHLVPKPQLTPVTAVPCVLTWCLNINQPLYLLQSVVPTWCFNLK